ncbi:uncharacterized protein BO97DRAFT_456467 [Aspergillus homomorphus CBS 101889]|uniref:Uncharacterized protein n=1 Tax=Aspergillus homomorphus (strain CBS 101889) TaxID=1450537 RepID=A0A395HU08_ASPHC|nr:hypothetical protein BO97DRAFT_456467 [Aspergillus homomorphus CBS 101889]RAL10308.1 hypothetical protein BO97DRAFT_456467 [Aspergillus homomorphus CBS 101889]
MSLPSNGRRKVCNRKPVSSCQEKETETTGTISPPSQPNSESPQAPSTAAPDPAAFPTTGALPPIPLPSRFSIEQITIPAEKANAIEEIQNTTIYSNDNRTHPSPFRTQTMWIKDATYVTRVEWMGPGTRELRGDEWETVCMVELCGQFRYVRDEVRSINHHQPLFGYIRRGASVQLFSESLREEEEEEEQVADSSRSTDSGSHGDDDMTLERYHFDGRSTFEWYDDLLVVCRPWLLGIPAQEFTARQAEWCRGFPAAEGNAGDGGGGPAVPDCGDEWLRRLAGGLDGVILYLESLLRGEVEDVDLHRTEEMTTFPLLWLSELWM